jgi:hypothetical protein
MQYDMLMDDDKERIEDLFMKVFGSAFNGHKNHLNTAKSKLEIKNFFVMEMVESEINRV